MYITGQAKMSQPIYGNIVTDGSLDVNGHAKRNQTQQQTGSDRVRIRSSRAAPVCLVLLCVLLLTAVIVLSVYIQTKKTNYTKERDQLLNNITNLTEQRDQLRNELQICDGWIHYQSSFYYIPNETKNWTESRRYCTERGADLTVINNREEQDFVKNMSGSAIVWIGLTDSDVEGRWKWVDGTNMNSGFWGTNEPNGRNRENCVLTVAVPTKWPGLVGWLDEACDRAYQWICEKNISQLIMP